MMLTFSFRSGASWRMVSLLLGVLGSCGGPSKGRPGQEAAEEGAAPERSLDAAPSGSTPRSLPDAAAPLPRNGAFAAERDAASVSVPERDAARVPDRDVLAAAEGRRVDALAPATDATLARDGASGAASGRRDGTVVEVLQPDALPITYAACPAAAACKILPLGDSLTEGVGSSGGGYRPQLFRRALQSGQGIDFVGTQESGPTSVDGTPFDRQHEGHPSWRIDQLDDPGYGLAAKITGLGPHIILLHMGTNDLIQQVDVPRAPARLGTLLDHIIAAAPNALIVVAQLIPCRFDYAKCDGRVITYNDAIAVQVRDRAVAGKHVALVDMHAVLPLSSLGDEIHPGDTGYAAMGNAWYARIGTLLPPK